MNGVPIARLFGIEIRLHLSWIFIVAIITVDRRRPAGERLPSRDAVPTRRSPGRSALAASLGFMLTVIAHELAHALVERRDGTTVDVDLGPLHRLARGRRRPGARRRGRRPRSPSPGR